MHWFFSTLYSSVGKKLMMALTGLGFILFILVHMAGNFTLYAGADTFNSYAHHLHSLGRFLWIFHAGLLFFGAIHLSSGILLALQNFMARPIRYRVDKPAGGRTWGSATMFYTGFILLIFVIIHLVNFTFIDKSGTTIYAIVKSAFSHPLYVIIYIIAMIAVALHASHGFWSLFQSLGLNHEKYMPFLRGFGLVLAVIVGLGFGIIPIYIFLLN
jgi:succinate dehydrogenase / fumarate reductase cytochrome b subunit